MSPSTLPPPASAVRAYAAARDRGPLDPPSRATPRRRGRPPLATPEEVMDQIRTVARAGGLFRVHVVNPALYARARRLWGSWAGALLAAGIDHGATVSAARRRALETRKHRRMESPGPTQEGKHKP